MKILLSTEDFFPIIGGGEVWSIELLEELGKLGHDASVIYAGKECHNSHFRTYCIPPAEAYKNIPLFNRTLVRHYFANKRWEKILDRHIREHKPDVILTQLMYTPASVKVARKHNIPCVIYIHNYEHFCPGFFMTKHPDECNHRCLSCLPASYKAQYPFIAKLMKMHKQAMAGADLVIANSRYVAKICKDFYSLQAEVLYPIIGTEKYLVNKNSREFVTLVNPIKNKGVEIFIEIAKRMPNKRFLAVGGAFPGFIDEVKKLKNITYIPWTDDMKKDVYSRTKMLIIPSQHRPEPFGRIGVEAAANGIPCIVSNLGGIPEACGPGGMVIDDYKSSDSWVAAIKKMEKPDVYARYSKAGKRHAANFNRARQMERFISMLKKHKIVK